MKKKKKQKKVKIRRTWNIDPSTKIHKSDKEYNRSKEKLNWMDELEDELQEDNDFDNF